MIVFDEVLLATTLAESGAKLRAASDFTAWRRLDMKKVRRAMELAEQVQDLATEVSEVLGTHNELAELHAVNLVFIKHRLWEMDVSASDLARETGLARQTVSQVMNGLTKPGSPAEKKIMEYIDSLSDE